MICGFYSKLKCVNYLLGKVTINLSKSYPSGQINTDLRI